MADQNPAASAFIRVQNAVVTAISMSPGEVMAWTLDATVEAIQRVPIEVARVSLFQPWPLQAAGEAVSGPVVENDRCWIGIHVGFANPPQVTRLRRVAEIWKDQGLAVSEWVPAEKLREANATRSQLLADLQALEAEMASRVTEQKDRAEAAEFQRDTLHEEKARLCRLLRELEEACDQLAGTRSSETYLRMIDVDRAGDALERIDNARVAARVCLSEVRQ